ncbi:MAG: response regulator [Rhodospirillales bacterium]|nr:response regulator [Rhodospirillales bacterium]
MDGLTFLQKFRTLKPGVPFVMLTAKTDTKSFHSVKKMPGTYFFMKPLDPEDLGGRLKSIIDQNAT